MTESMQAVDIHSHIIFKADDGAQSIEEAIDLLQLDRAEGIRTVFATPHYGIENGYAPDKDDVQRKFSILKEAAK